MEPKPSRLPRRITVQPSPSSPISARMLRTSRLGGHSETYRMRDGSLRRDTDFQDSSQLRTSSRDWTFRERDGLERSWKTPPTYQRCSGTYDLPISGSYLANRSRTSTASSSAQPSWYDPLERSQSTYTGLHSQQQDWDSKRPKLSYSGRTPLSGVRATSDSYTSSPDTPSRYGRFPRTTSMFHSDITSERERRSDTSSRGLTDYGHRNGDSAPSYLQDRVSSYAQGARPKENSQSTVRLNTSINHQLPSQSSSLLRDSSRSSRSTMSRDIRSPQSSLDFRHTSSRNEGTARTASGRVSPAPPRSASEQNTDTEGRRTTRHLLSRLASSMSSTFFSRRSSQDSLSGRSTEAEEAHSSLQTASQPVAITPANTHTPETRPSEQSQGFAFLRRRRWGLSSVSPNQSSDSDAESYRSEDSETRTSGSWLPSSLRNRCTPLFSRRRREGREEPFRASSTSDSSRMQSLLRRASQEDSSLDEVHPVPRAGSSSPLSSDSLNGSAQAASLAESLFSRRNSGISGMLPNSFLHFSVPAALGSSLSDNVMITVDIVPSGRTSDGQETEKSANSRDPEKLKKIQESLLLEDSEEEDGDLCRICQTGATTPTNPFIEPCKCSGSLQYVHQDCMKKWLHAKIDSGSSLETITTCELCKEKLDLNLEDFDIHELYRAHANERAEYEFISSGLYLVVLLHLCEQRFSDMLGAANEANTRVRFINLARTLQAHMEDLETSEDDSEDERV
ncbi:E3 ubiquitin-protein ligase MARCHF7 isoform X1 [Bufo bufo]|uniref:E3 ubiquitin-protein ligase MARCHF7 isoform X1 n=1 Tax=Bufo bufo TaxID=8384 RepID=UPI001ABE86CB|nr:E3 ubiquitin-protein ligase MARCHF7 isoform X1 [Bufo bufo]XP_040296246.1 E3 ubiquitin-protein ligase MARCHF7 isoform X1 [Bufo bufo]